MQTERTCNFSTLECTAIIQDPVKPDERPLDRCLEDFMGTVPLFLGAPPLQLNRRPRRPPLLACSATRGIHLSSGRGDEVSERSVTIIGGGPAGFFCAIEAARASHGHFQAVTILESTKNVLQKVRVSGGGRCNCTNAADDAAFHEGYPPGRGRNELRSPLAAFPATAARAWFEAEGVPLKVEVTGKVFPVSDSSDSIVQALQNAAVVAGVKVRTSVHVENVELHPSESGKFVVSVRGERPITSDIVCLATGASREAHQWMKSLGHDVVRPVPSLFTFKVKDPRLEGLQGLAVPDVEVSLSFSDADPKSADPAVRGGNDPSGRKRRAKRSRSSTSDGLKQRGPLLVTHWGLSGPAVIQLSSFGARTLFDAGYKASCVVNFVPRVTREEKVKTLRDARARLALKDVRTMFPFRGEDMLPLRLWRSLVNFSIGSKPLRWIDVSNKDVEDIADVLHRSIFAVRGRGTFKDEFVTAGGVSTKSLFTKSFESRIVPGLFIIGEAVNVDGKTGGYNFQSCWSTGYVAGQTIGRNLISECRTSSGPGM